MLKRLCFKSGDNKQQQKVAITSPVGQETSSQKIEMTSPVGQKKQDGKWVVSFMMPVPFTLETTPEPLDPNVYIREVPARLVAAIRYSGFGNEKSYRLNLEKLQDWTASNSLIPVGEPISTRYNPPFMIPMAAYREHVAEVAQSQTLIDFSLRHAMLVNDDSHSTTTWSWSRMKDKAEYRNSATLCTEGRSPLLFDSTSRIYRT